MSKWQAWVVTGAALCVLAFAALFVGVWALNMSVAAKDRERREELRRAQDAEDAQLKRELDELARRREGR